MSDYHTGRDGGKRNGGAGNLTSITSNPTITDSLDIVFDLLSDVRRRYLLYYLVTMDGDVTDRDAAVNAVYEYEAANAGTDDCPTPENIQIEFHHTHLPRLEDAGLVEYDHRHSTIRFTGNPVFDELVEYAHDKELD